MEDSVLSLTWSNHHPTLLQEVATLRHQRCYTDVTLACDGRLYHAHKFVLAMCSEYFRNIFNSGSVAGNNSNLVIVLKDVECHDVERLLDFIYLGEVEVAHSNLPSFILTAENLKIKGLAFPDQGHHAAATGDVLFPDQEEANKEAFKDQEGNRTKGSFPDQELVAKDEWHSTKSVLFADQEGSDVSSASLTLSQTQEVMRGVDDSGMDVTQSAESVPAARKSEAEAVRKGHNAGAKTASNREGIYVGSSPPLKRKKLHDYSSEKTSSSTHSSYVASNSTSTSQQSYASGGSSVDSTASCLVNNSSSGSGGGTQSISPTSTPQQRHTTSSSSNSTSVRKSTQAPPPQPPPPPEPSSPPPAQAPSSLSPPPPPPPPPPPEQEHKKTSTLLQQPSSSSLNLTLAQSMKSDVLSPSCSSFAAEEANIKQEVPDVGEASEASAPTAGPTGGFLSPPSKEVGELKEEPANDGEEPGPSGLHTVGAVEECWSTGGGVVDGDPEADMGDGDGNGVGGEGHGSDTDTTGKQNIWIDHELLTAEVDIPSMSVSGGGSHLAVGPGGVGRLYSAMETSVTSMERLQQAMTVNDAGVYSCTYCNVRTNHKNNMRKHIRTHTKEKPFVCHLCDYTAARKDTIERHIVKHINAIIP